MELAHQHTDKADFNLGSIPNAGIKLTSDLIPESDSASDFEEERGEGMTFAAIAAVRLIPTVC
jgi:hypothetical protein